ncbi:MAG: ribbon-helix-helix protein, CopG family [Thermoplasmata archaeon]
MSDDQDQSRITVRLSPESLKKINSLISEGKYKNISEFIRESIDSHLEELLSSGPSQKMALRLGRNEINYIEEMVKKGMAVDSEDLIRSAVRDYIRARIRELQKDELNRVAQNE